MADEENSTEETTEDNPEATAEEAASAEAQEVAVGEGGQDASQGTEETAPSGVMVDEEDLISDEEALENLDAMGDIVLGVTAVLGTVEMPIDQYLKLGKGAIIELNQHKDDLVDVQCNGYSIGRGDITVVENKVAIIMTDYGHKNNKVTSEADMADAMEGGGDDEMDMAAAMEGDGGDDEMDMAAAMEEMEN